MNCQLPDPALAQEPRPQAEPSSDQRFKIAFWMMKYETFLFHTAPYSTHERYTRALDKLFAHFPEKRFLHEFRRAELEDFKKQRLQQGASPKTVNIELSIIRSFWNFLLKAEADGVFFNPAQGVRVKTPLLGGSRNPAPVPQTVEQEAEGKRKNRPKRGAVSSRQRPCRFVLSIATSQALE